MPNIEQGRPIEFIRHRRESQGYQKVTDEDSYYGNRTSIEWVDNRTELDQDNPINKKGNMKTIKYNNKEYKLPFDVALPDDPTAEVEIANRFSGEKTTMPEFAAAVYDAIIGSEMFGDYDTVRKGLDWFKQHFAAQYMVVLD